MNVVGADSPSGGSPCSPHGRAMSEDPSSADAWPTAVYGRDIHTTAMYILHYTYDCF